MYQEEEEVQSKLHGLLSRDSEVRGRGCTSSYRQLDVDNSSPRAR